MGAAGVFGFFDVIFLLIPKAVIFPILIFIGLEITAQSFHATPPRHFPAVAFACIPALAYLAVLAVNRVLSAPGGTPFAALPPEIQGWIQTLTVLAGGGTFILTSLIWASSLAYVIDGRIKSASAAPCSWPESWRFFGIIHSPLSSAPIASPGSVIARLKADGRYAATAGQTPYHWSAAYALAAVALLLLGRFGKPPLPEPTDPPAND